MIEQYCVVSLNGVVTNELYTIKRPPDTKSIVLIESVDGKCIRVHLDRLIPADCCGKPIIVNKVLKTVCPKCRHLVDVTTNNFVNCERCGPQLYTVSSVATPCSSSNKEEVMDKVSVDLKFIATHGTDLWHRELKFDHPNVETVGYALLADNPPRKLCFQTYGGSLGKKSDGLARLKLTDFAANQHNGNGKPAWSVLKGALDEERKKLTQLGYVPVGGQ